MDPARILVTAGGLVLIGLTLWFFFGAPAAGTATGAGTAEGAGTATGAGTAAGAGTAEGAGTATDKGNHVAGSLYACPMHPWITSPDPTANCSICGMKLSEKAKVKRKNVKRNGLSA